MKVEDKVRRFFKDTKLPRTIKYLSERFMCSEATVSQICLNLWKEGFLIREKKNGALVYRRASSTPPEKS